MDSPELCLFHRLVTILILLELTLQYKKAKANNTNKNSHNPYFIGINLAITVNLPEGITQEKSQSLFYWN